MSFQKQFNNFPAGWRKVVDTWGDLNNQYFKRDGDLPAWYVENSNSALFSAAAWIHGYPALCEMDVEKKLYTGDRGRPKSYAGRMDIELEINGIRYWVEAKRRAFALSEESQYSLRHSFLVNSLWDAWGDARQCRPAAQDFQARMVAVVFFSCHISLEAPERHTNPSQREQLLASEMEQMHSAINALASKMDRNVYRAVFAQNDFHIHRSWNDYLWPAAFGLCAIFDD